MNIKDRLEKCFVDGGVDLRLLMESFNVCFENLSLADVRFIEGECGELRQKFEDAEKVECFKTTNLQSIGFSDLSYFSLDEVEIVKALASKKIEGGDFRFKVERVKISQDVLTGHVRDRKEWEKV